MSQTRELMQYLHVDVIVDVTVPCYLQRLARVLPCVETGVTQDVAERHLAHDALVPRPPRMRQDLV